MKKIGLLLLAGLMLFTLAACARTGSVPDSEENESLRAAVTVRLNGYYLETKGALPEQLDVILRSVTETETGCEVSGTAASTFHNGELYYPNMVDFRAVCLRDDTSGGFTADTFDVTVQSTSTIEFSGLGIRMDPDKTLPFSVFGKEIYYYGVIIALGFVLAIVYAKFRCKEFGVSFDSVTDAIIFAVPAAIICARIYYVAFSWGYYKAHLDEVIKIWKGGIAIYGGVIGAALGLLLFSKVRKKKIAPYLDIMGLGLLIGQLIGRWGNFFNREAHGAETGKNFFLRMYMYSSQNNMFGNWHPTFLYESLWNLLGFILLHFYSRKRKYDGQIFLMYVAWYGLGRVWIEGLRTDSLWIGPLRVSQLLAGLSFLAAVGVMAWIQIKKKPDGSGLQVRTLQKEAEAEQTKAEAEQADETES